MGVSRIQNPRLSWGENFIILWLYNLKLEQAIRILACSDSEEIYEITNEWVHVSSLLVSNDGGRRVGIIEIACAFLRGFLLGDSNLEKGSDHQKKKFFINKSIWALILLKKGYQSLLKLHVPFRGVPARGKMRLSPKTRFCLKQKYNMWGGFSGPIEILYIQWLQILSWEGRIWIELEPDSWW